MRGKTPNDFGHRVYAQVISTLLIPSSEPRGNPGTAESPSVGRQSLIHAIPPR